MSSTKNALKALAFLSPWLIGLILFVALPIALSFYYSFRDYSLIQAAPSQFIGMDNYRQMLGDPQFWHVLKNTVLYAALAVPASLAVSLVLALLLNTQVPGQAVFRTIIFLPALVPAVAAALLWAWLFNSRVGLINSSLSLIHLSTPNWLADYALPSLALMGLWGVGYTVVILLAGLQNIPRELYEAANIDGASPLRRLWHITIPTLSPVIFFNLIMALIATFQVFTIPTLMLKAGLNPEANFYSMYLFDQAFTFNHMGYASAMAWIQFLIILGLTVLAFWSSKRWVHYR